MKLIGVIIARLSKSFWGVGIGEDTLGPDYSLIHRRLHLHRGLNLVFGLVTSCFGGKTV